MTAIIYVLMVEAIILTLAIVAIPLNRPGR